MHTDDFRRIAVIAAGSNEEYQASVLSGIADEVRERQINAVCFTAFGGVLENSLCDIGENNIYRLPDFRQFDGAVLLTNTLMDPAVRAGVVDAVRSAGIPAAVLDDSSCDAFFNIRIDNEKAMREMVEHVISVHGAKTLAYISGPLENPEANSRYLAFLGVMEAHQLPAERERIYFGDFRPFSGRDAAEAFLGSGLPLPDAVICANDAMALEVIGAFRQHGIRVPEDVLVTGFDHTYYAQHHNPSLTSVARPLYEAGRTAVRKLAGIWEGEEPSGSVTLETSLALMESCGCISSEKLDIRMYRESMSELIARARTDISLFNRMTSSLASAETTEENVRMLGRFMQELGCEECALCLCDNWQDAFRGDAVDGGSLLSGYTEYMSAPYIRTENGMCAVGRFRSTELFPIPPAGGGNISFILPLHFRERCIGYYIITNGDFPVRSMLCHTFMLGISHSLENIRKLTNLNNAVSELDRLYVTDPLCGIYNRNGFIRLADRLFRHCMYSGEILMIGFIDMDGLKYVNDNFGHDDGDFALQQLAQVISECCGERLTCARFGGDEFIVIGSGLTKADAEHFERQFGEKLEQVNAVSGKPYRVEASIGTFLTEVTPEKKLFELIAEADQVMYEQKKRKGISRYLRRE